MAWAYPTTKSGVTIAQVKADQLFGMALATAAGVTFTDADLWRHIRAAEDFLERDLATFLRPVRIITEPESGDTYDVEEPAYDYESDFNKGERWGWLKLRYYPIRGVNSMKFAYPNKDQTIFTVPTSWIKVDKLFGVLRIVPDGVSVYSNFSSYMFSLLHGGSGVPQSIFVDYLAGFTTQELADNHTDLLVAVQRRTVLDLLPILFGQRFQAGDSGTVSADGLSQSRSGGAAIFKATADYYERADAAFRTAWKDKIKGIQTVAV